MSFEIACPAKINLTLEVLDRGPDGYHGLRSLMVPLDLVDDLSVDSTPEFSFECDDPALSNEENLAVRAARALETEPHIAIRLRKRIPYQAGLGGGSSDAAGVLKAAMHGAFGHAFAIDWIALARSLGSDVPFFLTGTGALVEGTGDRVTAVGSLPDWHALVVKPPVSVSTADAYAELDRHLRPSRPRNASVSLRALAALQRGDFDELERSLSNDFHDVLAAGTPEVARTIDALRRAGARNALLAGSGAAVFALARDEDALASILERLDLEPEYRRFPTKFARNDAWRCATT
jgi:4-diphosphocytidyl-2-C-methyl-D-erythritol kinase